MKPGYGSPLDERWAGLVDRIDYRLIETPEKKDLIYSLRYRAYLNGGLILPSESERVSDRYDDAPNAWTFGIYVDDELCASLRLHVLTSEQRMSYTTECFGDILHHRLDRGEVFIDPARFVVDPEQARRFPKLPYVTLRLAYLACEYFNADTGLALVQAEHQSFYRRVFLHEAIGEPRSIPGLGTGKVALMASDFRRLRDKVLVRFPIMRSSAFERRMLFERMSIARFPDLQMGLMRWLETSSATQTHGDLQHETGEMGLMQSLKTVSATQTRGDIQRETTEIIRRISKWAGGEEKARLWFRSEGIPAFGGRTAEALVREGRATEVRDFLDHVALGGYA